MIDKYGMQLSILNLLFISIDERAGKAFIFEQGCSSHPPMENPPIIHVRDLYIQLGKWSLTLAVKSRRCL